MNTMPPIIRIRPILLACLLPLCLWAQTDPFAARYGGSNKSKPGATKPDPQDLRQVDGKVYDPSRSVLWKTLTGDCLEVTTNGLIVQEVYIDRTTAPNFVPYAQSIGAYGSAPGRHTVSELRRPGKKFFLRNYPMTLHPTAGKSITARGLHTGSITITGQELECWDYGTRYLPPAPHPRPRTNTIPPISPIVPTSEISNLKSQIPTNSPP